MPPLTTLQQESLVSLKSPGFFLDWFSCVPSNRLHSSQPNHSFLQSLSLSTYPTPMPVGRQKSVIVWELLVPMQNSLCFALCTPLTVLASETLMFLPVPTTEWGFLVFRTFFSLIAPSQRHRSCPNSLVSFFFLFILAISLPFWKSGVFYQHLVGIGPHVDIFCCICVVEGDHHDSSAILKILSGIVSLISLSNLPLLLYRNAIYFCVLILYPATLPIHSWVLIIFW